MECHVRVLFPLLTLLFSSEKRMKKGVTLDFQNFLDEVLQQCFQKKANCPYFMFVYIPGT